MEIKFPTDQPFNPPFFVIWVSLKIAPKSSGQPSFSQFLDRGQFRPLPKPPHSTGKHKVGMPLTSCENRCMGLTDDLWMISLSKNDDIML